MKSDREFLDGIYEKSKDLLLDITIERVDKVKSTPYRKYIGMAASILLLISSILFIESGINKSIEKNMLEDNNTHNVNQVQAPVPRGVMMISYVEQLLAEASGIIEVEGVKGQDGIEIQIIEIHRRLEVTFDLSDYLNKVIIPLEDGETAIVFIQSQLEDIQIIDVFKYSEESMHYVNEYGEVIGIEQLESIKQ